MAPNIVWRASIVEVISKIMLLESLGYSGTSYRGVPTTNNYYVDFGDLDFGSRAYYVMISLRDELQ